MRWQRPRKATPFTGGLIVLHSDDGRMYDYSEYVKTIRRTINKNEQFKPLKNAIFCPAVNSGYIASGKERQHNFDVMTDKELKVIDSNGGEILSHCKYHVYLDYTNVTRALNVGADTIYHSGDKIRFMEGLSFFIEDGLNKDTFTVTEIGTITENENYIKISPALTHDYTTAAKLHITEATANELLLENVATLLSYGITCKHHINPWYRNSALSKTWLKNVFESVITTIGTFSPTSNIDFYDLKRSQDIRHYSTGDIDTLLSYTKNTGKVVFIQAHGQLSPEINAKYEYLINKAYETGMRIVTHSEAINFLKENY